MEGYWEALSASPMTPRLSSSRPKNAFCIFLDGNDDRYYSSTRMAIYQLLHSSDTRAQSEVDFVVLVSETVDSARRERLEADGAVVIEADNISARKENLWITPGRSRWVHVVDKMHAFKLIQYERVLLLDSDTIVLKPLDGIFNSSEAAILDNKAIMSNIKADEAPQPARYLMAGNSGPFSTLHDYPSERGSKINAGFVLLQPSIELYNYHLSIMAIEGRFNPSSPEQNMWNWAHRLDGNMPWVQVDPDWTTNCPNYEDYEHGIRSFHEKWWISDRSNELMDLMRQSRFRMEGYWLGIQDMKLSR